jgi:hypothetical protein
VALVLHSHRTLRHGVELLSLLDHQDLGSVGPSRNASQNSSQVMKAGFGWLAA